MIFSAASWKRKTGPAFSTNLADGERVKLTIALETRVPQRGYSNKIEPTHRRNWIVVCCSDSAGLLSLTVRPEALMTCARSIAVARARTHRADEQVLDVLRPALAGWQLGVGRSSRNDGRCGRQRRRQRRRAFRPDRRLEHRHRAARQTTRTEQRRSLSCRAAERAGQGRANRRRASRVGFAARAVSSTLEAPTARPQRRAGCRTLHARTVVVDCIVHCG